MKTSVVLFDAAGVLFPVNTAVQDSLKQTFDLSDDQLLSMWSGIYRELSVGAIDTPTFLDQFAASYGLDRARVTEAVFVDSFAKALQPMPGVAELLERLSATSVTLALLSDTTPLFAAVRHELGYYRHFDTLFFSYEVGYLKPDARMYQAVIDHYNVPASEIFFIDDRPKNIVGAVAQGMRGVVFRDAAQLETTLAQEGIL